MSNSHLGRRSALIASLAAILATPARSQLISPKTVPVHQSEQFNIYPSQWPAMGGVSIALQDTLGDPWVNPAKATRLVWGSIQVMPSVHSATVGGGRSLPVSILQTSGSFAGGALFTLQELDNRATWSNQPLRDRRASNQYFSGVLARRLDNGLSIGAGISTASLRGVDGVAALYAGSDRIRQSGGLFDARLGLTKDFEGGATLEVVAVNNRYRMTHDVHFPAFRQWRPCDCIPGAPCTCEPIDVAARDERNLDRTTTAGLHAVFLAPKTSDGWRLGYLFTANRQSHPKIPNYQIQNIPRDPGSTSAYNFGFGASRSMGQSTFGIDAVVEPIWSHTWADAAGDTTDVHGVVIPQGAHTVDNRFRFSNSRINVGFSTDVSSDSSSTMSLQLGMAVRTIAYTLDQTNHVQRNSRTLDEGWAEWTPTLGLRVRGKGFEFSYGFSLTCGPSCNVIGGGDDVSVTAPPAGGPVVLAAPAAPLTFDGGSSSQHRVMLSVRLR